MTPSAETTVVRDDSRSRYVIRVGDDRAGFLLLRPAPDGRIVLVHTEIDGGFEGQGLGSVLASEALADLARRGEIVVPACPFIAHYLKQNEVAGLEIEWPDDDDAGDAAAPAEPA